MMAAAGSVVVALLLITAGCGRARPDTPVSEPQTVATRPAAPQVAGSGAPAAKAPAARAPVARTPAAAPPLDLKSLTQQLRATKAIGVFTKITLKNQVDDLLDGFREYYRSKATLGMTDLRRSFDLLMMKVLSLLQDDDQMLASAIVSSREAIWKFLADPRTFASLDV